MAEMMFGIPPPEPILEAPRDPAAAKTPSYYTLSPRTPAHYTLSPRTLAFAPIPPPNYKLYDSLSFYMKAILICEVAQPLNKQPVSPVKLPHQSGPFFKPREMIDVDVAFEDEEHSEEEPYEEEAEKNEDDPKKDPDFDA